MYTNFQSRDLKSVLPPRKVVDKMKETASLDQPDAVFKSSSVWQSPRLNSKYSEKTIRNAALVDSSNKDLLRSREAVDTLSKEPVKSAGVERPSMAIPKAEVASGISDDVRAEIVFSTGLIVRRDRIGSAAAIWNGAVSNFKRFKKVPSDITGFMMSGIVKLLNQLFSSFTILSIESLELVFPWHITVG